MSGVKCFLRMHYIPANLLPSVDSHHAAAASQSLFYHISFSEYEIIRYDSCHDHFCLCAAKILCRSVVDMLRLIQEYDLA